jgi:hypothetical protein
MTDYNFFRVYDKKRKKDIYCELRYNSKMRPPCHLYEMRKCELMLRDVYFRASNPHEDKTSEFVEEFKLLPIGPWMPYKDLVLLPDNPVIKHVQAFD